MVREGMQAAAVIHAQRKAAVSVHHRPARKCRVRLRCIPVRVGVGNPAGAGRCLIPALKKLSVSDVCDAGRQI